MLLYVLECAPVNNKPTWYIGVSYCLNNRVAQHCSGRGSAWVRLHPVKRIAEVRNFATLAMEKEVTLQYMLKYGWEQVRGGPYSKPFMRRPPKELRDVPSTYAEALTADTSQADEPVGVLQV